MPDSNVQISDHSIFYFYCQSHLARSYEHVEAELGNTGEG
jgi:hypothetical protein